MKPRDAGVTGIAAVYWELRELQGQTGRGTLRDWAPCVTTAKTDY